MSQCRLENREEFRFSIKERMIAEQKDIEKERRDINKNTILDKNIFLFNKKVTGRLRGEGEWRIETMRKMVIKGRGRLGR